MDIAEKSRLSRIYDTGIVAAAIRLRAARLACNLSQAEVARALGLPRTTNINNMENAVTFPNRDIMEYYFREHRIDYNFLMAGAYSQLPGDVQDRLFPALAAATNDLAKKLD